MKIIIQACSSVSLELWELKTDIIYIKIYTRDIAFDRVSSLVSNHSLLIVTTYTMFSSHTVECQLRKYLNNIMLILDYNVLNLILNNFSDICLKDTSMFNIKQTFLYNTIKLCVDTCFCPKLLVTLSDANSSRSASSNRY